MKKHIGTWIALGTAAFAAVCAAKSLLALKQALQEKEAAEAAAAEPEAAEPEEAEDFTEVGEEA